MGSSISRIYDEYDRYDKFCEMVNAAPLDVQDDFLKHEEELMEKYGYVRDGWAYKKIKLFTEKEVKKIAKEAVGLWRNEHDKKVYQNKEHFGEWFKKKIK